MDVTPRGLRALFRSPSGLKLMKYTAVSVISVAVSQVTLLAVLHLGVKATLSNIIAVAVGTVPSYELNRKWAWGKSGKSHLWREVVPFWAMSFLGLALSTLAVYLVKEQVLGREPANAAERLVISLTNLAAFGVLWFGKFLVINKLLFVHRHDHGAEREPVSEPVG